MRTGRCNFLPIARPPAFCYAVSQWTAERQSKWSPPVRVAVGLLGLRVVLIEVVAQLDQFSFSPVLYLIVPFYASMYFSMRVSYWVAGLVALAYVGKLTWYQQDWYTDQGLVRDFLV